MLFVVVLLSSFFLTFYLHYFEAGDVADIICIIIIFIQVILEEITLAL